MVTTGTSMPKLRIYYRQEKLFFQICFLNLKSAWKIEFPQLIRLAAFYTWTRPLTYITTQAIKVWGLHRKAISNIYHGGF